MVSRQVGSRVRQVARFLMLLPAERDVSRPQAEYDAAARQRQTVARISMEQRAFLNIGAF